MCAANSSVVVDPLPTLLKSKNSYQLKDAAVWESEMRRKKKVAKTSALHQSDFFLDTPMQESGRGSALP